MAIFSKGGGKERARMKDIDLTTTRFPSGVKVEIVTLGTADVKVEGSAHDAIEAAYDILKKSRKIPRENWGVQLLQMRIRPAYIKVRIKRKRPDTQA